MTKQSVVVHNEPEVEAKALEWILSGIRQITAGSKKSFTVTALGKILGVKIRDGFMVRQALYIAEARGHIVYVGRRWSLPDSPEMQTRLAELAKMQKWKRGWGKRPRRSRANDRLHSNDPAVRRAAYKGS